MLRFHIITLFPESFSYLGESIIGRAIENKKIVVSFSNPRDFTRDKHRITDDKAYGGGPGMVMKAEPVLKAIDKAIGKKKNALVIMFTPSGEQFKNEMARDIAENKKDVVLVCGHYEGVDERVVEALRERGIEVRKVSVGPYVLSGGELPAMVVVDAVARQIPGVLGKSESLEESRAASPEVYTRPESFTYKKKTYRVPEVLRSGDHKKIEEWRRKIKNKS
ncbi:MAG: tRNA (guanosine(37)-N1)-methyltransferase TrmD [Parcubacteria group bacterium]|nr:tRNA (guanosine(37)-N1)-methyltransferase TrmD [Parcubacteria group bacterium]